MHSYPTDSPSRNQPAVASTGNRWTAIRSIYFSTLPPRNRVTRRACIIGFPNHQRKEQRFLPGLKTGVSALNI